MSEEVEVMSAEDIPRSTPTKVGARPFNSTAIRVHWNPVPNVRDKVRFRLYFGSVKNSFYLSCHLSRFLLMLPFKFSFKLRWSIKYFIEKVANLTNILARSVVS